MKTAYFPFTYLSEPTARLLKALVGPVRVYQPIKTATPAELAEGASRGLIEVRTPITEDDDRLRAALAEFTEWARQNPGRSTAGADFLGARQGAVPFFDENAIQRIRSDFRKFSRSDQAEDTSDDLFSARLFLALAQENDQAVERMDRDLDRFKVMEKAFLEDLKDADAAGFNREAYGSTLWREDPGAKLTGQRLHAWAGLAGVDENPPEVLVTTSPAVIEYLLENAGDTAALAKLADVRLDVRKHSGDPILGCVLAGLLDGSLALDADFEKAGLPSAAEAGVRVHLYAALNQPRNIFFETMGAPSRPPESTRTDGHPLVLLMDI
jgi:hypothetical protein